MKRFYKVTVGEHSITVKGSSAQNACRQAFRLLIRAEAIKRQPRLDQDGEWEDTEVELV